ncbi:hypothetical protein pb186bvf_012174 [Paramecium bursaria]
MNNKIRKTNKKQQNEDLSSEKYFADDLIYNFQPQQYEIDDAIRVIGKFQNYFIHAKNKILNGTLITTAYVKFEKSLKIQFRMKNLVLQQIFKLNGYTKVGIFIIKKGQIMFRMCQNIINCQRQIIILENVISSNDAIINVIIQKYYVFFYPYLFDMNLSSLNQMVGMKKSQFQYVQQLEEQIKSHLKDFSKQNQEIVDSQIVGQPNIQEVFIHGDQCIQKNRAFEVKFNFKNAQSDIYQTNFLFIKSDAYMEVLEKSNSPFLETIYKYNEEHYREKNQNILSLHQLILNNKPLGLLRRLQIVRDVCEGIKTFQHLQREDFQSQNLQQNADTLKKDYLQIKIINPHTIMITPQLSSFILIWPYQNDNDNKYLFQKGRYQNQYLNFQYKENNQHVEINKLEKHTIFSIGKLLCLLFSSKTFQIEGPNLFMESIKHLIFLCNNQQYLGQNNSNITIQSVVALIQNYQISKILNEKSKEIINTQQFQIISAEGKQVKVYDQDQLLFTLNLVKKIKRITLDYIKSIVYVCDKHGDVFNLDLKNLIGTEKKDIKHIQNNLAIPESCQFFHANNKSYIIQGDSYSKIKLYNAELIDEIIQIWVPFEGFLKQVISQEKLYLVFKRFDENVNSF